MQPTYNLSSVSVSNSDLRELSVLTPWRSFFAIFIEWSLIMLFVLFSKIYTNPFIYLISWFIISTRLYAMYSLIHDAVHYSISRNKLINDFIAQVFLGFPLFISLTTIRKNHLNHHKYLQTENDPEMKHLEYDEFHFPQTRTKLLKILLLDISGISFIKYKLMKLFLIIRNINQLKFKDILFVFGFVAIVIASVYAGIAMDLLLYWIIPYATLYQALNRIRLSTEHFNIADTNPFKTRSVIPSVLERFIFTPYNLGYHLEHHLYPSVPFYNLPKLHNLLSKNKEYTSNALVNSSYLQVLQYFIKST